MSDEELSREEREALVEYLTKTGTPMADDKQSVHSFLNKIATAPDTTKVGFLEVEELGSPKYPVRAFKEFSLIADDIIGNKNISDFFNKQSEIITSTSLSKEGFLVKQATTTTRQIADITKKKKKKDKWFFRKMEKKKEEEE